MLHLLPDTQKKIVLGEYHKRLGIVISSFTIALCFIGAVLLIPSYMYANNRYDGLQDAKNTVDKSISALQGDKTAEIVNKINDTIASLEPIGGAQAPSEVIDKVISYAGSGIHLTHFVYTLSEDYILKLQVDGQADTRASLIAFSNNLKVDPYFQGAVVPLSTFTKERDILFTFKLTVPGKVSSTEGK